MTVTTAQSSPSPGRYRFTREKYYRMVDMGLFTDTRVELIDGEIIAMSPQRDVHSVTLTLIDAALRTVFSNCVFRTQMPLSLPGDNEPEPDFAVVAGSPRDYAGLGHHPTTALLIVEVSDTTLRHDRGAKASRYAEAGVADYWIVNIEEEVVEVHRQPMKDPSHPLKWRYQSIMRLDKSAAISPLASPAHSVAVRDLLL
jgi:Uma2 family endonuclease